MEKHLFEKLTASEESALGYVLAKRYAHGHVSCPACGSARIYRLASDRYRCAPEKYTFGPLTGTWLGEGKIPVSKRLHLVRAYLDGHTASQARGLAGVSYGAARRVYDAIWHAVHAHQRALPTEVKCGSVRGGVKS